MNSKKTDELSSIGEFTVHIANQYRNIGAYPVLGSEGNEMFIEISSGNMEERTIHKTIYIIISKREFTEGIAVSSGSDEIFAPMSDMSYFISLIFLLSAALGKDLKILHPLDKTGNYLGRWKNILSTIY